MTVFEYCTVISPYGQTSFSDANGLGYSTWFYNQEIPPFLYDYEINRLSAELGMNAPSIHLFLDARGSELTQKHIEYNQQRGVE